MGGDRNIFYRHEGQPIRRSSHSEADVVCSSCHSIHKSQTPKFLLARKQADLCYSCHANIRAQFEMPSKHRVNEGFMQCSDCHNPHTGKTRAAGNDVCAQCHATAKYETTAHHFHPPTSEGAKCVSCHMPTTTYMQIDPRHDHSLRIPRPDLTVRIGVPNACNRCHTDRDARWAVERLRSHNKSAPGFQRFAGSFAADDRRDPGAADSLATIANDPSLGAVPQGFRRADRAIVASMERSVHLRAVARASVIDREPPAATGHP